LDDRQNIQTHAGVVDAGTDVQREQAECREGFQKMQPRPEDEDRDVKNAQHQQGAREPDGDVVLGCCGKNREEHGTDTCVFDHLCRPFVRHFFRKPDKKHGDGEAQEKHPHDGPGQRGIVLTVHCQWVEQVAQVVVLPTEAARVLVVLRSAGVEGGGGEKE